MSQKTKRSEARHANLTKVLCVSARLLFIRLPLSHAHFRHHVNLSWVFSDFFGCNAYVWCMYVGFQSHSVFMVGGAEVTAFSSGVECRGTRAFMCEKGRLLKARSSETRGITPSPD